MNTTRKKRKIIGYIVKAGNGPMRLGKDGCLWSSDRYSVFKSRHDAKKAIQLSMGNSELGGFWDIWPVEIIPVEEV